MMTIKNKWLCIAGILIAVLYLWHLGNYPLINPDEGRYAEVPREMIASGDFITPRLNGVEFFDKPALQYWMSAIFMMVFGQNEYAVRLFPALCALGGIACIYVLGTKMFDQKTGFKAALILATSLLYFILSSINILDMAVSFFITLALTMFYLFSISYEKKYLYIFYAAMALGVLAKGLIAIVLPGVIIALYAAITRQGQLLKRSFSLLGVILFFLITVPWFYLVCRANPDFFQFFFIEQHFLRYTTKMYDRFQPWYFFIPCLILGVFPWTGFLLASLIQKPKAVLNALKNSIANKQYIFLLLWAGVIFCFYSMSGSKLIPYILPCFAPLSVFIAARLNALKLMKAALVINAAVSFIFFAAFIIAAVRTDFLEVRELIKFGIPLMMLFAVPPILSLYYFFKRKNISAVMRICFAAGILFCFALQPITSEIAEHRTGKDTAQIVNQWKNNNTIVICYKDYLRDLPFYTGERVLLYDYLNELEFGSQHASGQGWFIKEPQELHRIWQESSNAILVIPKKEKNDAFATLDLSNAQIAETEKYIIAKQP